MTDRVMPCVLKFALVGLLVLNIVCAGVSTVAGPLSVLDEFGARRDDPAWFPAWLYVVRAVPLGVAGILLSLLALIGRPVRALPVVLLISAAVQAADVFIGLQAGRPLLYWGAGAFAVVHALTAALVLYLGTSGFAVVPLIRGWKLRLRG